MRLVKIRVRVRVRVRARAMEIMEIIMVKFYKFWVLQFWVLLLKL